MSESGMISHRMHQHANTPAARVKCRDQLELDQLLLPVSAEIDEIEARIVAVKAKIRDILK